MNCFKCSLAILIVAVFFLPLSGYAWGPKDESWQRTQKKYREQTKAAKRIDPATAYNLFASKKAVLISVDPPDYYKRRHIEGSYNIPPVKLKKIKLSSFKNKIVLLYCR